jgi:hypothetical protein
VPHVGGNGPASADIGVAGCAAPCAHVSLTVW